MAVDPVPTSRLFTGRSAAASDGKIVELRRSWTKRR